MAAFFIAQRLPEVVKTLLETASLLPETMQFLRNCPEKVEYSIPSAWRLVESRILYVGIREIMQHIFRSGRPYPNIVHNVQSPALKQTRLPYIKISRICRHSRQSVVSNPSAFGWWWKVECCMLGYRKACCCTFDSYSALKQTIRPQEYKNGYAILGSGWCNPCRLQE